MLAIPGAEGMFSPIQSALVKAVSSNSIKVDWSTRDKLRDWKWLAGDIATLPTSIAKSFPIVGDSGYKSVESAVECQ